MMRTVYFTILALLGAILLGSCDDGDTFTMSPNKSLSFSIDTVHFDTVFSTIPSSTRSFWVYNKSGDGLRCSSVRLENGNQTGFRVNVDGAYLSPDQGYKVNGIEVRNKDSIRVFVELTSAMANTVIPKEISDNLVFTLESGREQKVTLNAWSWDAVLLTNSVIEHDSVLASVSPIVVYGKMTVGEGATLTIAPGTTMYFHGDAGIDVKGRLICSGTPSANVVLRGDRLDNMFSYLPYDRMSGQWQGLHFAGSSYGNDISYTDIHGCFNGVVVDSSDVSRTKIAITNSTVHNCQGDAVRLANSKASLVNCQLTNTLGHCLMVDGGDVEVDNCTLAQFYPFDSSRGSALYFSGVDKSLQSFMCRNSIITGYSDDEMIWGKPHDGSSNAFNYNFYNCIIRTPEVDDSLSTYFEKTVFEDVKDTVSYGLKHFVNVDGDMQLYDFHLRATSAAIDAADSATATSSDRDGHQRDDKPDIGAFEYIKQE